MITNKELDELGEACQKFRDGNRTPQTYARFAELALDGIPRCLAKIDALDHNVECLQALAEEYEAKIRSLTVQLRKSNGPTWPLPDGVSND